MLITTLVATIFVFGILVFVHELGHFVVAKWVGMRVDEFALGFGPKLISVRRGETLYSLRIIPLGGFNKIAGMDPEEEQDEQSFNRKPIFARIAVIAAGSLMNFILPVILFIVIFSAYGMPVGSNEAIIGDIVGGKPAAVAGMKQGDRVLSINGQTVTSWQDFSKYISENAGKKISIALERDRKPLEVVVTPESDPKTGVGRIGVMSHTVYEKAGIGQSLSMALKTTLNFIVLMTQGIVQMITGTAPADIAGPIGVAKMAGESAQRGFDSLLWFAALVSINLGLLNLFPLPVLDGGWILIMLVEWVRGKPLEPKVETAIKMIGFALIGFLVVFATSKDFIRLMTS